MPEPNEEPGTVEESLGWEEALAKQLSEEDSEPSIAAEAETEDEPVQESEEDALEPLERWSEEVKERFQSLDRNTQQFLLDREADVESHLTKKTQELSEIQKRHEGIDEILNPYDEVLRKQGIDLKPHLGQALQYYFAFQKDAPSTLKYLVQSSGVTAEQLGFGVEDDETDPNIRALRSELDKTRQELAELKQGSQQQDRSTLQSQIDSFKDAKDEEGNLKHPYFEQVRNLMAPLVDSGKSMEDSYAEVVWTIPEFRQSSEKAASEAAEKERKTKAEKARVEKLKKAQEAETLPSSDTEKGNGLGQFSGWDKALHETLSKME